MEPHINDLEYKRQEMIEFEPVYVQQFNSYMVVKGLLTYSLCGIDLHSKGMTHENSILIQSAIKWLNEFIEKQNEDYFSMLAKAKKQANLREDLLDLLRKVLSILEDKKQRTRDEYNRIYNDLKNLIDQLTSLNREVEEKILARYRNRGSYKV